MWEDKVFKGLVIFASGVVAAKSVKAVRYYKLQRDMHKEVEEDSNEPDCKE